ncbi:MULTISPECIES: hypothetical protein [Streptosporangium]|uniref:Uncharacterized protein n=1 Tax=Streptosporangium brasiliense TaxID=47480 RepID=A0ABT9RM56_9ACTN|nr:hypothetical protein [Streptosporangium brasiliense]MDP9869901.1 hypothetical protein [Streptosporangium brasiliense]
MTAVSDFPESPAKDPEQVIGIGEGHVGQGAATQQGLDEWFRILTCQVIHVALEERRERATVGLLLQPRQNELLDQVPGGAASRSDWMGPHGASASVAR